MEKTFQNPKFGLTNHQPKIIVTVGMLIDYVEGAPFY